MFARVQFIFDDKGREIFTRRQHGQNRQICPAANARNNLPNIRPRLFAAQHKETGRTKEEQEQQQQYE